MNLTVLTIVLALGAIDEPAAVFSEDFRGKPIEDLKVLPSSKEARDFFHSDPEGLRITLPAGPVKRRETGVLVPFRLEGDFEVSTTFQIVRLDPPDADGMGVSFEIYLTTDTPTGEALTFTRTIQPDGGGWYFVNRLTTDVGGKRRWPKGVTADSPSRASGMSGQLLIKRTGADAALAASEDGGATFRICYRLPLGPEPVSKLRIGINPRSATTLIDLRLVNLQIKSNLLPDPNAALTPGFLRNQRLWWLAALLIALLIIGGVGIWLRRKQGSATDSPENLPHAS
jgi:hypothetical protein